MPNDAPHPGPEPVAPTYPEAEATALLASIGTLIEQLSTSRTSASTAASDALTDWKGKGRDDFSDITVRILAAMSTAGTDLADDQATLLEEIAAAQEAKRQYLVAHAAWTLDLQAWNDARATGGN